MESWKRLARHSTETSVALSLDLLDDTAEAAV